MSYKITHFNVNGSEANFITSVSGSITYNNKADNEDLVNVNNSIKFADKEYSSTNFSGLGRVYLRKNISSNKNILKQSMLSAENTIYIIQYDYDLNGASITVPNNCVLDFQGGSFKNGTLTGQYTCIKTDLIQIFKTNLSLTGTFSNNFIELEWFGINTDNTEQLNIIFENFNNVRINTIGYVIINGTVNMHGNKKLHISNDVTLRKEANETKPMFHIDGNNNTIIGDSFNSKIHSIVPTEYGIISIGDYDEYTSHQSGCFNKISNLSLYGKKSDTIQSKCI